MSKLKNEILRLELKKCFKNSKRIKIFKEENYSEYSKLCDELNYPKEEKETFKKFEWNNNDDLTNLFKYLDFKDEDDFINVKQFQRCDLPRIIFRDYLEPSEQQPIPVIRFTSPIPYPLLYVCVMFYSQGRVSSSSIEKHHLYTLFIILSQYDEKYWMDSTYMPNWEIKENILLKKLVSFIITMTEHAPICNYVNISELFRMVYERTDVETDAELVYLLRMLIKDSTRTISMELEKIDRMEKGEERSQLLKKLLSFVEKSDLRDAFNKYDLFSIIADESEEMEIRDTAFDHYVCHTGSESDLFFFASLVSTSTSRTIQDRAFGCCCQIVFNPRYANNSDSKALSQVLFNASMSYPVDSVSDAIRLLKFLVLHSSSIELHTELSVILWRVMDFVCEFDSENLELLCNALKKRPDIAMAEVIIPQLMKIVMNMNNVSLTRLAKEFVKRYPSVKALDCKNKYLEFMECDEGGREVLNSVFALLKHRKQWMDRKFRTDPTNQLMSLISKLNEEDIKLDGPNESFYAFLFEQVCLQNLDKLEFSVGTNENTSMFMPNFLDSDIFGFKMITVKIPKTITGILKWLGFGVILSIIYSLLLYWRVSVRRRNYQSYRMISK